MDVQHLAYYGRDVDSPDEVTLWAAGHVTLEYVRFSVDTSYFSPIILERHLFHWPILPVLKHHISVQVEWNYYCTLEMYIVLNHGFYQYHSPSGLTLA